MSLPYWCLVAALALGAYTYLGYPLLLYIIGLIRRTARPGPAPGSWPTVTITLPAYNEEETIADTIESLLRLDYPAERLDVLVVSDASTDRTDEIVRRYAGDGVTLLRLARRMGKTAAENAGRRRARGEIVVNTDASVRVPPDSLKPLIAAFADPTVGVASGRDISVARRLEAVNLAEAGYVGYEMWVRALETRAGGLIGTSGCFFASRASVLDSELPPALSWDFAAPLIARERGFRTVSVNDAVCHVPRATSLKIEYRRKVRTIARGMQTLFYKKHLLNPLRYGTFSWKLISHKICRWSLPWALVVAAGAVVALSPTTIWARWVILALGGVALLPVLGGPGRGRLPRILSVASFLIAGNLAVIHASLRAARGVATPTWEPTRRDPGPVSGASGR